MSIENREIDDAAAAVAELPLEAEDQVDDTEETGEASTLEVEIPGDEKDEGQEDEHKPAPNWVRKVREDNRKLRQELSRIKAQMNNAQPEEKPIGPKPTLKDHDFDTDKYEAALEAWQDRKRKADEAKSKAEEAAKAEGEAWKGKLDAYGKAKAKLGVTDFEDAEAVVLDVLDVTQQGIIVHGAADPALIVYALGKNEAKARELADIKDPVAFAFAVARLEGQMKVTKSKPTTKPEERVSGDAKPSGIGDAALERLRAEAMKTGDYTKVNAYKRNKKRS